MKKEVVVVLGKTSVAFESELGIRVSSSLVCAMTTDTLTVFDHRSLNGLGLLSVSESGRWTYTLDREERVISTEVFVNDQPYLPGEEIRFIPPGGSVLEFL